MDALSLDQMNANITGRQYSNADELSAKVRFVAVKEHLSCSLQGEAVVLSLKNGKYYGFNAVSATIWETLQSSVTIHQIKTAVMREYDVDPDLCNQDILSFLNKMTKEGLIEILDE